MIDLFIILVFLLLVGIGLYRGFIKEILGLFGFVSAISLSVVVNKWIVTNILNYNNDQGLSSIIAYVVSFFFFLIVFGIIISLILRFIKTDDTSIGDRIFGGIIGFLKAYLLCLLFYFVIYAFNSTLKPDLNENDNIREVENLTPGWLKDSKTYPFFFNSVIKMDDILKKLLNDSNEKKIETKEENKDADEKNDNKIEKKDDDKKSEKDQATSVSSDS